MQWAAGRRGVLVSLAWRKWCCGEQNVRCEGWGQIARAGPQGWLKEGFCAQGALTCQGYSACSPPSLAADQAQEENVLPSSGQRWGWPCLGMERSRGTRKREKCAVSAAPDRGRDCPVLSCQLPLHWEKGKGVLGIFEGESEMGFKAFSLAVVSSSTLKVWKQPWAIKKYHGFKAQPYDSKIFYNPAF